MHLISVFLTGLLIMPAYTNSTMYLHFHKQLIKLTISDLTGSIKQGLENYFPNLSIYMNCPGILLKHRYWWAGQVWSPGFCITGMPLVLLLRHTLRLEVDLGTSCLGSTPGFEVHHPVWRFTSSCPSWVTLDVLLSPSVTQFPCFKSGDNASIYLPGLFWGLHGCQKF